MPPLRTSLVFIASLILTGCASTSADLVPLPSTEGLFTVSEDGTARLQVQVQNQGMVASQSSPVAITFFLRKLTVTSAIQDGGPLEPGDSSGVLEFEVPDLCKEEGCRYRVSVDPEEHIEDGNRSNNLASGRLVGQAAPTHVPTLGNLDSDKNNEPSTSVTTEPPHGQEIPQKNR